MKLPSARRPWVAASLIDFNRLPEHAGRARREGANLLEIRVDLFPRYTLSPDILKDALRAARRAARLPVLLTLRNRREGGRWPFTEERRSALYAALMPSVDGVDVEGTSSIAGKVIRAARRRGRWVVLSHHDFGKTPGDRALRRIFERFRRSRADILKVAALPQRREDVERLMRFCAGMTGRRAFISMGALGRRTRLEGPRWGSCLTYGSVGRSAAPGQVPVRTLAKALR